MHYQPSGLSTLSKLLTPKQTSEYIGVSEGTLTVWRCTGRYDLKYCKIGRKVMYHPDDIQSFIESRTKSHTDEGGAI